MRSKKTRGRDKTFHEVHGCLMQLIHTKNTQVILRTILKTHGTCVYVWQSGTKCSDTLQHMGFYSHSCKVRLSMRIDVQLSFANSSGYSPPRTTIFRDVRSCDIMVRFTQNSCNIWSNIVGLTKFSVWRSMAFFVLALNITWSITNTVDDLLNRYKCWFFKRFPVSKSYPCKVGSFFFLPPPTSQTKLTSCPVHRSLASPSTFSRSHSLMAASKRPT